MFIVFQTVCQCVVRLENLKFQLQPDGVTKLCIQTIVDENTLFLLVMYLYVYVEKKIHTFIQIYTLLLITFCFQTHSFVLVLFIHISNQIVTMMLKKR